VSALLTVKLRRDLRATWPRIVLMVIAIAVSLTVFSAVLFAWSTLSRETSRAYLSTAPASATILLDGAIDAEQMAAIAAGARGRPGVIEATGRTQFTGEIAVDGRVSDNPLQVFAAAPDDPMRLARFEVQQGSWPPAPGDILLDRATLTLVGLAIGDTMVVETPGGAPVRLRVAGVVYDPSLVPAAQHLQGHGYLSTASLATPVLDQLKIQVADPGRRCRAVTAMRSWPLPATSASGCSGNTGWPSARSRCPSPMRTPTRDKPTPCCSRCLPAARSPWC